MPAGSGAEWLYSTLESITLPLKNVPNGLHGTLHSTGAYSSQDVAASTPSTQQTPLAWDPACTTILRLMDSQWAMSTISSYNFNEALWGSFPMEGAKDDERFWIDNIIHLSMGAFKM